MKRYMVWLENEELDVDAETKEEAIARAVPHFTKRLTELLNIAELKPRTERCSICQYTYPPAEMITREDEQLCRSCDNDKYPLDREDIPF